MHREKNIGAIFILFVVGFIYQTVYYHYHYNLFFYIIRFFKESLFLSILSCFLFLFLSLPIDLI